MTATFGEPMWPFRIVIFDNDGRIFIKNFRTVQERDTAAKDLKLNKATGETALAIRVDYTLDKGDEPKRK